MGVGDKWQGHYSGKLLRSSFHSKAPLKWVIFSVKEASNCFYMIEQVNDKAS